VPIIGDDIKAQLGATIVHRVLTDLFKKRGVKLDRTYQLNTGGNTDFLNMLERSGSSLQEGIQDRGGAIGCGEADRRREHPCRPSDYVAWQNDNKVCFLRMEGQLFGGVPMNLELRLSVEDSPNSAGVAIDMIRCAKLARIAAWQGPCTPPPLWFCKHPPSPDARRRGARRARSLYRMKPTPAANPPLGPPPQPQSRGIARVIGTGVVTGAADDDPSAIGTYASAGAKFGLAFLWIAPVLLPMMYVVVYLSAKIGRVYGKGLFAAIRDRYPRWLLYPLMIGAFIGNVIEAAANLGGIGAALNLLAPPPFR
jgi:hypothetical protein